MSEITGPYIPLPDTEEASPCVCGSGISYGRCCKPRLDRLDRAMGFLETWRGSRRHTGVFRAHSDLLWEEQYRDEEQGKLAQEYPEWDEWASFLWLEGVLLDGITLPGVPPVPESVRARLRAGDRMPGGRRTYEALFTSCEALYEIRSLPSSDRPGLVQLWMPPMEETIVEVPRVFFPEDSEPTDLIVGRFIQAGPIAYPTHRPLVIPVLEDASNYDSAYRVLAPLLPSDPANPVSLEVMIRMLKVRGDLLLRTALEALVPGEMDEASDLRGLPPDGGEIRFMVSDAATVTHALDNDPYFSVPEPSSSEHTLEDELEDLLTGEESLPFPPESRRWHLRLDREGRRRLPPAERKQVEQLLWGLARRIRPRAGEDWLEHVAEDPGVLLAVIEEEGTLYVRALHFPALELGRLLVEREVGSFVAREGEKHLAS